MLIARDAHFTVVHCGGSPRNVIARKVQSSMTLSTPVIPAQSMKKQKIVTNNIQII